MKSGAKQCLFVAGLILGLIFACSGTAAAAVEEIPFTFEHNTIVLENVTVGDAGPYRAMLDTGSTLNVVDMGIVEAIGLVQDGSISAFATGGGIEAPTYKGPAVAVAGKQILAPGATFISGPLSDKFAAVEEQVDMILGSPLFKDRVVQVDFTSKVLRLIPREEFVAPTSGAAMELKFILDIPVIPITVEGHDAQASLDLGSSSAFDAYPEFMERTGLNQRHTMYRMPVIGMGGSADSHLLRVKNVTLGPYEFEDIRVYSHAEGMKDIDGLIGNEIMRRFLVSFDFQGNMVYFEPGPAMDDPWIEERAGMTVLTIQGQYVVYSRAEQSPSHIGGLQVGDIVTEVNGSPAHEVGIPALRLLVREPAGTIIRLTVMRGGVPLPVKIVLDDYVK